MASFSLVILWIAISIPSDEESFGAAAKRDKDASAWDSLEGHARAQLETDPDDDVAQAYLATALAGLKRFDECVEAMKPLDPVDRSVPGFGVPMSEVINTIWGHCWANYDPAFNRACFAALYAAFPDAPGADVAASRLLMAAVKLDDPAEIAALDARFSQRAADARATGGDLARALRLHAEGYLRADRADERVLGLVEESYRLTWSRAVATRGLDEESPDPTVRDLCEVDADSAFNNLALATHLAGRFEPEESLLASQEAAPGASFEDITDAVGLGGLQRSRVAAGDFDGDGDPDLCFSGRLYRNHKGRFSDCTEESGVTRAGASALFGDTDNDGDLDLVLPAAPHPFLMQNQGRSHDYHFIDATSACGLDRLVLEAGPEGAAMVDFDRDGWLDLYLAVYEEPMSVGHRDVFARNRGDGTFEDGSSLLPSLASERCGRGVACADFDDDGAVDIHVSNYRLQPNSLFQRDAEGDVRDVAVELGVHGIEERGYFGHTIGSTFGDIDGDGDLDLFCANLAHPRFILQGFSNRCMLYINQGPDAASRFVDERAPRGVRFQETCSDPALVDYDNDGDLDLSITCVYEGRPSALYQNDGTGRFAPVTLRSGAVFFNGWGQAWLDYDDDGDLDLCAASGSGVRFLRNLGNDHRWLKVRLEQPSGAATVIGARVTVEPVDRDPPRRIVRELTAGRGTTSQDDAVLHFGLGDYKGKVRVTVRWPEDGVTESRASFVNRTLSMRRTKRGRR